MKLCKLCGKLMCNFNENEFCFCHFIDDVLLGMKKQEVIDNKRRLVRNKRMRGWSKLWMRKRRAKLKAERIII